MFSVSVDFRCFLFSVLSLILREGRHTKKESSLSCQGWGTTVGCDTSLCCQFQLCGVSGVEGPQVQLRSAWRQSSAQGIHVLPRIPTRSVAFYICFCAAAFLHMTRPWSGFAPDGLAMSEDRAHCHDVSPTLTVLSTKLLEPSPDLRPTLTKLRVLLEEAVHTIAERQGST